MSQHVITDNDIIMVLQNRGKELIESWNRYPNPIKYGVDQTVSREQQDYDLFLFKQDQYHCGVFYTRMRAYIFKMIKCHKLGKPIPPHLDFIYNGDLKCLMI